MKTRITTKQLTNKKGGKIGTKLVGIKRKVVGLLVRLQLFQRFDNDMAGCVVMTAFWSLRRHPRSFLFLG